MRTLDAIVLIPALVFAFRISALGNSLSLQSPIETTFNFAAGRGDCLFITVSSEDGNEWLFGVDTGSPVTVLDRSFEPILGPSIGHKRLRYAWFENATGAKFRSPHLKLEGQPLRLGKTVITDDLSRLCPGRPLAGILGLDCLKQYALSLNFRTHHLTLTPEGGGVPGAPVPIPSPAGLELPLSLTSGRARVLTTIFGERVDLCFDTGDPVDAELGPDLFRRALKEQGLISSNHWPSATGQLIEEIEVQNGSWNSFHYTNLILSLAHPVNRFRVNIGGREWGFWKTTENMAGLRWLARHDVVFDFPRRRLYLDQHSTGPLPSSTEETPATLAWWERAKLSPNISSAELAKILLAAPAIHPVGLLSPSFQWARLQRELKKLRIQLNPSETLRGLELEPADYHLEFTSEPCSTNQTKLTLEVQEAPPGPHPFRAGNDTILLLHDYNSEKSLLTWWAYILAQQGFRTVAVDLRGHGESSGSRVTYGSKELADLRKVLDRIQETHPHSNMGVLGLGYGARLGLMLAAHDSRVKTVVAIAPELDPALAMERAARAHSLTTTALSEAIVLAAQSLWTDWSTLSARNALTAMTQPVFLIGGRKDQIVLPSELEHLHRVNPPNSQLLLVKDADHDQIAYWLHEIAIPVQNWFHRWLPT
ncbi:MAG TPA: alpha/beta fold hydrolase [Verrucomicrobiae bacterium]|nr:alpha/beta fold hydrolase [Verrucomicrobiae bacterium]